MKSKVSASSFGFWKKVALILLLRARSRSGRRIHDRVAVVTQEKTHIKNARRIPGKKEL
jgi:hypothetical protein